LSTPDRHHPSVPLLLVRQDGITLIKQPVSALQRKKKRAHPWLGEVASTVKIPAALSNPKEIGQRKEEMSKHDTVPAPVEEFEYAPALCEDTSPSVLTLSSYEGLPPDYTLGHNMLAGAFAGIAVSDILSQGDQYRG
jgi:hypothetical protein